MSITSITKSEAIYNEIKKEILNGTLKPGTRLLIQHIANQYGVSDIPVREALRELTSEGFVETTPHVGSRVASMSLKGIEEMFFMREFLEPLAAELAVENIDEQTIAVLERYYYEMESALEAGDVIEYRDLNRAFHKLFIEASGNELLTKTIFELMESEKRMQMIFQLFPEIIETSNTEHSIILQFIKDRNGKALAKVVYDHKKKVFDKMRQYLRSQFNV